MAARNIHLCQCLLHPLMKAQRRSWKTRQKECERRAVKCCLLDLIANMVNLHNTGTRSIQKKSDTDGRMDLEDSHFTEKHHWLVIVIGTGEKVLMVWSLVGLPCSDGWFYTMHILVTLTGLSIEVVIMKIRRGRGK